MGIDKEMIEKTRREFQRMVAAMWRRVPYLAMLLRKMWIVADDREETASTDGRYIYINPRWWLSLPPNDRMYVLIHEALHVISEHPRRLIAIHRFFSDLPPNIVAEVANVVMDAKINPLIPVKPSRLEPVMPDTIEKLFNVKDVEKRCAEDIVYEILKRIRINGMKISLPQIIGDVKPCSRRRDNSGGNGGSKDGRDDGQGGGGSGDRRRDDASQNSNDSSGGGDEERRDISNDMVINRGDEGIANARNDKELRAAIRNVVLSVLVAAKSIGTAPGEFIRYLEEIAKPKVDWRRLLRQALQPFVGRQVARTFSRPSRKMMATGIDGIPGKRTIGTARTLVLVDTSGSIGEKELRQFVGEVYAIARHCSEVIVIPWDATAYDPITLRSSSDINKLRTGLRGGGGTVIRPALELAKRLMRPGDAIIILSDWCIYDIDDVETQRLLGELSRMASVAIAVTTAAAPRTPPGFKHIKLEIENNGH